MAVPHIQSAEIEGGADAGNLARIGNNCIFRTYLPRLSRPRRARSDPLPIDDAELNLMQVNRMGVVGEVMNVPKFRRAGLWVFGDRIVPSLRDGLLPAHDTQEHRYWAERLLVVFQLIECELADAISRKRCRRLRQCQRRRHQRGIAAGKRFIDIETHHLSGRVLISDIEIGSRLAPAKRLIRPDVEKKEAAAGESGEIDDAVDAFRRRDQKLGTGDGLLQEAAVGADLPELQVRGCLRRGSDNEPQDEEAAAAGIEDAQSVAAWLHRQLWPRIAVDDDRVGEELRIPDGRHIAVRAIRGRCLVEEESGGRIEERAVGIEAAVLNHEGAFMVVVRQGVPVEIVRAATEQVKAGEAGIYVDTGHTEYMVVKPEGGCRLVVVVVEGSRTGQPRSVALLVKLLAEGVVPGTDPCVIARDVDGIGQEPCFGIAVALVRRMAAMQMRH